MKAFPVTAQNYEPRFADAGMDLRDYFAAKVMQGFAADSNICNTIDDLAALAYKWADAMLRERNKS